MKLWSARFGLPALAVATAVCANVTLAADDARPLVINPAGTQPSAKGSAQYFTGAVRVDMLNAAKEPSRTASAYVTFEPERAHCMAYPSAGPDAGRDGGRGARAALGWAHRAHPSG